MTIPVFPSLIGLDWPTVRTRTGKTVVHSAISGKETRLQVQVWPKYTWTLSYAFLRNSVTNAEFQSLMAFYNTVAGQALPFYYSDPDDGTITTAQGFGTGNGTQTDFQLVRSLGGFVEPVQSPVGISLFVAGTIYGGGFSFIAPGVVRFPSPPAAGAALTWTGTYYWLCRFTSDDLVVEKQASTYYLSKKVEFTSVPL